MSIHDPSRLNSDANLTALGYADSTHDQAYPYCMTDRQWLDHATFEATAVETRHAEPVDPGDECRQRVRLITAGKAKLRREIHLCSATIRRIVDYYLEAITDPVKVHMWSRFDQGVLAPGIMGPAGAAGAVVTSAYKIHLGLTAPLYDKSYAVMRNRTYTILAQQELRRIDHETEMPVSRVVTKIVDACHDDREHSSSTTYTGSFDAWDRSILDSLRLGNARNEFVRWLDAGDVAKLTPRAR